MMDKISLTPTLDFDLPATVRHALDDVVLFQQCYTTFMGKADERTMEVNFIVHTNRGEDEGTKDLSQTRKILNQSSSCSSSSSTRYCQIEKVTYNLYAGLLHLRLIATEGGSGTEGLLEPQSCLMELHAIVMEGLLTTKKCGRCSSLDRYTINPLNGHVHMYPKLETGDGERTLQLILDRYNDAIMRSLKINDNYARTEQVFKCAAFLLQSVLDLHPYADGNGRVARLLCNYVLRTITPFDTPIVGTCMYAVSKDRGHCPIHLTALLVESSQQTWKVFCYGGVQNV